MAGSSTISFRLGSDGIQLSTSATVCHVLSRQSQFSLFLFIAVYLSDNKLQLRSGATSAVPLSHSFLPITVFYFSTALSL